MDKGSYVSFYRLGYIVLPSTCNSGELMVLFTLLHEFASESEGIKYKKHVKYVLNFSAVLNVQPQTDLFKDVKYKRK